MTRRGLLAGLGTEIETKPTVRRVVLAAMSIVLSCGTVAPDRATPTVSASVPPAVAAPRVDPLVEAYLASNAGTFDLKEPPAGVPVSATRSLEIVAAATRGPIRKAEVLFGQLNFPRSGRPHLDAWLVLLIGPGIPSAASPATSSDPSAVARAQTLNTFFVFAFVDAKSGAVILLSGSSNP